MKTMNESLECLCDLNGELPSEFSVSNLTDCIAICCWDAHGASYEFQGDSGNCERIDRGDVLGLGGIFALPSMLLCSV